MPTAPANLKNSKVLTPTHLPPKTTNAGITAGLTQRKDSAVESTDNDLGKIKKIIPLATGPCRKLGILMQALPLTPLSDYVIALADLIGGSNMTHATRLSNGRICIYLKDEDSLNKFMTNHGGLTIKENFVVANRMSQKVQRMVISYVPPEFPSSDLSEILS
ncbi:hypothetical protein J437_LFUL018848 [Ladona fulva]|uniref:Uncharacterized protein n=1 Tax=Ladona fulva TaxID=123851 RepID=A0A8K0KQV0_LADFU|nr:hypothetical protein J437_LFUL018848 [Ladona fulva]